MPSAKSRWMEWAEVEGDRVDVVRLRQHQELLLDVEQVHRRLEPRHPRQEEVDDRTVDDMRGTALLNLP